MSSTRRIKNCDKENRQKDFDCINTFVSHEMSCNVPWLPDKSPEKDLCTSAKQLEEFVQLKHEITMDTQALEDFGCSKNNCVINKWSAKSLIKFTPGVLENNPTVGSFVEPNLTSIFIGMMSNEVDVKAEYELYDVASFFSDIGGFMGLLLGASMLSLIETLPSLFSTCHQPKLSNR